MDVVIEDDFVQGKVFKEATDAIENDLILVMDRFDREEVNNKI